MLSSYLTLGALALGSVSAWTFPDCNPDDCWRNLADSRLVDKADAFCVSLLATPTTAASAVPTDFANCNLAAASSACSCIVYTLTHSSSASSSVPTTTLTSTTHSSSTTTTKSTATITSTISASKSGSTGMSTSTVEMTTSTVYTTKIYTVTSCAPTVTDCPARTGKLTTEIVSLYTTVCPVAKTTPISSAKYSTIYTTRIYTISSCPPEVTNCPVGSKTTTVYPIVTSVVSSSTAPKSIVTSAPVVKGTTSTSTSVGTVTSATKTTSSIALQVSAAAGRLANGLEIAIAAAGIVGAAFL